MTTTPNAAQLLAYGLLGLPLAFAALPLYVQWPAHAAQAWGLPLAGLGSLLLAVRLADALVDPALGRWVDACHARHPRRVWQLTGLAAVLLVGGFVALLLAPQAVRQQPAWLWVWAGAALVATSLGYSIGQIAHQSWAARLGGGTAVQARWVGAREAFALVGVLLASVLPVLAGWDAMPWLLAALLLAGWVLLARVMPTTAAPPAPGPVSAPVSAWRAPAFRRLMAVYVINGLASAWPATLVLWFMRDRLLAPAWAEGALLALYFASAALSVPLWTRAVARWGAASAWAAGMLLAVLAFMGVGLLGAGDLAGFALVCAGTGIALGADLVAPPTLLARQAAAQAGTAFGWWTAAGKLNLALAAGLALPLLQFGGFVPGQRDAGSLQVLAWAYAAVPCVLKLLALALLLSWRRGLDGAVQSRAGWTSSEAPCHP